MVTFEILSTKYFLYFKTFNKICGSRLCGQEYVWYTVHSNTMMDEQPVCEIDGFMILNGISNIVIVPFLEASTHDDSHTKEAE